MTDESDATLSVGRLHVATDGVAEVGFVMLPPNPLDGTAWLYQAARFSAWFRTLRIDLPGYGHSEALTGPTSMPQLARALWGAVDRAGVGSAVVAGISIGASLALHMATAAPDRVMAVVLSGCSYSATKPFAAERIAGYRADGLRYRSQHLRDGHSPGFIGSPMGRYLGQVAEERGRFVDVESIIRLYEAHGAPDPPALFDVRSPVLIVTGSEDYAHEGALLLHERISGSQLVTIEGAGHACNVERPMEWDAAVIGFLRDHGIGRFD